MNNRVSFVSSQQGQWVAAGRCSGWVGGWGAGSAGAPAGTGRELLLPPRCAANDPKLSFGCVAAVSSLCHCRLSFVAASAVIVRLCVYRHKPANTVGGLGGKHSQAELRHVPGKVALRRSFFWGRQ